MLDIIAGLYCVAFINPSGVVSGVQKQTSSFYPAQLNKFHLMTETESLSKMAYFK
jgi:hypothetical protein